MCNGISGLPFLQLLRQISRQFSAQQMHGIVWRVSGEASFKFNSLKPVNLSRVERLKGEIDIDIRMATPQPRQYSRTDIALLVLGLCAYYVLLKSINSNNAMRRDSIPGAQKPNNKYLRRSVGRRRCLSVSDLRATSEQCSSVAAWKREQGRAGEGIREIKF